jgi:glycogen debranching enzyme
MTDPEEEVSQKQGAQKDIELGSIQVLEGSTFMVSDARGDVHDGSVAGLYHEDTRHLNRFELTVGGKTPTLLTSNEVDYYSAAFFMTNPELDGLEPKALTVQRHRFVGDGLRETITVRNHTQEPIEVEVRLACGADFADLFEVRLAEFFKAGECRKDHDFARGHLHFEYEHELFKAATQITSSDARADGDDLVWDCSIEARGVWHTGVLVALTLDEQKKEPSHEDFGEPEREATKVLKKWQAETPEVTSGFDVVWHVMEKSVTDLASLRLQACVKGNEYSLPAAGLPWFMAIFGRDTLISSYQSLWVGPELAKGALEALAGFQGTEMNDFKDEEPGKMLHEIRFGELTTIGQKPHRPYYGSSDSTPLWLILLHEYWRWTGDDAPAKQLKDNALRALEWIDTYGDLDGDGFIEYETRSKQGLRTQCWKDSWNGLQFADGTVPDLPIAPSEVQGYAYDAKRRTADVAERVWGDAELASRLRKEAEELFARFNDAFWSDERGGFYAVGLDKDKKRIDSITSNMGHLLWSGIVPEDRAKKLVDHFFSDGMWSGWGVRTMSWDDAGYNPIGYHIGTVWPHDNSLIAAGLYRYGFREEANRIAASLLEAAEYTDWRLPEVFAGYSRGEAPFPVRYPTASSPQAWATAAPFLWFRLAMGLDVKDGQAVIDPQLPESLGEMGLKGIHAAGRRWEFTGKGSKGEIKKL